MHKKTYTVQEAQELLEKYCAYQERCHFHVEQKLKQMNIISQAREVIILHLMENDFLNEGRFTEAFVRGKLKIKKWGKHKITNELIQLKISKENIDKAFKKMDFESYKKTIAHLILKKTKPLNLKNIKHQKKCVNFLLSKGFEYQLIKEQIQDILKEHA